MDVLTLRVSGITLLSVAGLSNQKTQKGVSMEGLFGLALVAAIGWFFYKAGKSIGSRKGYNVGRSRGRWRRR